MKFYTIGHATFSPGHSLKVVPWFQTITKGIHTSPQCSCGCFPTKVDDDIEVRLGEKPFILWTDAVGCGHYPLFCLSEKFLELLIKNKLTFGKYHKIDITNVNIEKNGKPPQYYYLDGSTSNVAKADWETSGIKNIWYCDICGCQHKDSDFKKLGNYSLLNPDEITYDIFTSDISDTRFFCNEKVATLVKENNLTNIDIKEI